MHRAFTFVAAAAAAALPGCFIGGGPKNQSSTRDIVRPDAGPRSPESCYKSVEIEAGGFTSPVYEAPPDRAFVIHEIRISMPLDVIADTAGAIVPLLPFELAVIGQASSAPHGAGFSLALPAGVKLPPGAKLRFRSIKSNPAPAGTQVNVFVAGELVRM